MSFTKKFVNFHTSDGPEQHNRWYSGAIVQKWQGQDIDGGDDGRRQNPEGNLWYIQPTCKSEKEREKQSQK